VQSVEVNRCLRQVEMRGLEARAAGKARRPCSIWTVKRWIRKGGPLEKGLSLIFLVVCEKLLDYMVRCSLGGPGRPPRHLGGRPAAAVNGAVIQRGPGTPPAAPGGSGPSGGERFSVGLGVVFGGSVSCLGARIRVPWLKFAVMLPKIAGLHRVDLLSGFQ